MSVWKKIKNWATGFWHALTPSGLKCIVCNREIERDGQGSMCKKCLDALPLTGSHVCEKCGVKIGGESMYCNRCGGNQHRFDNCRSVCEFEGSGRDLVHRLKFGKQKYLAAPMAYFMSEVFNNQDWAVDVVVAVPMTPQAVKKRGYNQAYLLAAAFCDRMDLPLCEGVQKVKDTSVQATLNFSERMSNIKNAFEIIDKTVFKDKNVLVVDDVKTTGATLDEMAAVLKKAARKKCTD